MSDLKAKNWCLIPAAGIGSRMAGDCPKQYLPLGDRTILERVLDIFIALDDVDGIVVAIAENDPWWPQLKINQDQVWSTTGGPERAHSVLNGLRYLIEVVRADLNDWVMVHDAARPCINPDDVRTLMRNCRAHDCGGVVGSDLVDTIKRKGASGRIAATESRELLWRAMTPQMFRIGSLMAAIQSALDHNINITDESMAMELAGELPMMVECGPNNIKITREQDIVLASLLLGL